ncbi:hypothetical protein JD844_019498 [Phrynosoma platyrhinos]|uniref:Polycystin-1 n=1 Tax=Phrynosoma platyrhinos TaxID=52577 RepID=A0ABQ7TQ74_PHRPL|nr:hypothetical protein JD844_019498 [Phrynosoma platyrhinos]
MEEPAIFPMIENGNKKVTKGFSGLQDHSLKKVLTLVRDLSNNRISTLEDGIFDNLFNLSEINLSSNPFLCDCNLAWLPRWLEERNVKVAHASATKCAQPPEVANLPLFNVSFIDITCGADYIGCLTDNHTGVADSIVQFTAQLSQNLTEAACGAHCYAEELDYGGFSDEAHCLCGVALEPNSSMGCLPFCTELSVGPLCGGPSLVSNIFPAHLSVSIVGPGIPVALYQEVVFELHAPITVDLLQWDFGDHTGHLNTTRTVVHHTYTSPGLYNVTATIFVRSRSISAQAHVGVVSPPEDLELLCPPLVKTNESLQLRIRNRGGTGLSVVYSIVAQDQQPGNTFVSSPEIQNFLVSRVTRSLDVWIGFNDVSSPSSPSEREEGFNLQSCQNWLPGEPHPSNADHCVRMGPAGQCNTDLCTAKHSYVCEHKPQGIKTNFCPFPSLKTEILLNAEHFSLGAPAFDASVPMGNVTEREALSAPLGTVETMVFPGLTFPQKGFLAALEFVTRELQHSVQVRFRVHRPAHAKGCKDVRNGTAPLSSSQEDGMWPQTDCPVGLSWCRLTNTCLPFGGCCDESGACANDSVASTPSPILHLSPNPFPNVEFKESLFALPPGPSMLYLMLFKNKDISVGPNDTVSIQHDAGPGAFLLCHPNQTPSSQMNYYTWNSSSWESDFPPVRHTSGSWHNGSTCEFRLLSATEETVPIIREENSGVASPGFYAVKAVVDNGVFKTNLSCDFWVASPVSGLQVIYPPEQGGKIYVEVNHTWLVLKIFSGVNGSSGWLGGNQSFPFERNCPPSVAPMVAECAQESNDTWFSVVKLGGIGENVSTVVLWAENAVSSQNITVLVKAEEAIRGLRATPDPESRILLNNRVTYIPMMDAGSDVTFRWTVDDKPSFTFYNEFFHVIYQTPAVYKLSLTASNHVSNVTVDYNITVEKMNRMKDLAVSEIPPRVAQNSTVELAATVLVDSAVEATFMWDFGDGDRTFSQFRPPYNDSFLVPDPTVHQVVLGHNVSHTYQEPGEYTLTVVVSNEFENLTYSVPVHIYTYLMELTMEIDADVLVVGRPVTFEAQPLPSNYGVSYLWDFGDGSVVYVESQSTVVHTYNTKGIYNVSLRANNTISAIETSQRYRVFEEITGLQVTVDEAMEVRMPVEISASVKTGDNITWIFDMGDGTVVQTSEASVNHSYLKEMNGTVNVTAINPVNSVSQAVPVQVFLLMVLKIEPSTCIQEHPNVQLTAFVSGNPDDYFFDWTFGDGSSNVTMYGDPTVIHNFTRSGIFSLSLVLSSKVNKAQYYTEVCVEPEITNVTLFARSHFVRLGNESKFQVTALPPYHYRYHWDFGANDSARFGGTEVSYTYKTPGVYLVVVTVCNNVSFNNDSALVEVQEPVGVAKIESNASKVLEVNQVYLFSANVSGSKVSYLWDFGDGTTQLGKFITHSYNKSGTYPISLTAWNEVSFREARLNVTVKRRLQGLSINASRTVVPLNGSVSFTATLLAGTAIRYSWILCDRCTPIPGFSTISYTFRSIGTFNVIVTAENEIGCLQDSIFIYVLQQIEGLQIVGNDLLDDAYFPTNKTLQLQAAVRDGTNISYSWVVLKENHSVQTFTGKTFSLVILEAGVYVIHLKATNMLGGLAVNKTVEFIEQVGVLKLTASPNPAAVNASVSISTTITAGTGLEYMWYLEEGAPLITTSSMIMYYFQSPGAKVVTVEAENKLGSTNATLVVYVQQPVMGLQIKTIRPNCTYIESGSVVNFSGELESGSDVAWVWKMPNGTITGQRVALTFPTPGFFSVCLNASNDVSWEGACHNLTVQDPIRDLRLRVSKEVLEPGEEASFVIEMSSGSSVSYQVSVGGNHSVALNTSKFTHTFTQVGDYVVQVTAENHVSVVHAEVLIVVLEAIHGLRVVDCCERGTPTGVERHFTAEIESGSRVSYLWQLTLEEDGGHAQTALLEGPSISYTPEVAGQLDIHLHASNLLGSLNLTIVIQVQDLITQLSLLPVKPFANRTTLFEASVKPSARQVVFWWHFGDGSPVQRTDVASASHTYLRPGDYVVQVNATNLISFSFAHLTVTVQVLECEEPEAELALPAQVVMKRSQKNYLEAQIDLRGCIRYKTAYLWEIYRAPSCLQLGGSHKVQLLNVDVNRPQLVIPKLALDLGNYCFKFLVSFGDTPLSKSTFANVTVLPNKLVPIIDGGSYRVWSSTRDLVLDGEKSYDPNLEDWEQTPLHYNWSCVSSSKSSSSKCALNFSAMGGVVTVSRAILEADVEYTFALSVWKTGMSPESTNQTKGTVPIVSLECISCKAQSVYAVSRSSYVYLEGTCLNCQNNSKMGRWAAHSFKNKTLVLDRSTTSTGDTGMNLVLRPWALKDGEGYTFTLHITDLATGEEGYASMDLFPNQPPFGGSCWLSPMGPVQALTAKIHFECTGWRDTENEGTPLVYILLATRCRIGHCEEFWVYKGSHSEHAAFLPPGFQESGSLVSVSVLVQDQLGATVVAFNSSMAITLPSVPEGFGSLPQWLYNQTEVVLQGLVKQGDPQQVIEYTLALITILNEYECSIHSKPEAEREDRLRAWTRRNITETLVSLNVNTVDDIQQIAAVLAQCTVANKEFVCRDCLMKTLEKLESMMAILQGETTQGTMTPTTIADNILNIMGDLIHLVNTVPRESEPQELCSGQRPVEVASKAYALSTDLMRILMKSRVLNEEPLELAGTNITAKGKRADPFGLLCYEDNPACQFSIPPSFNATFSNMTDVVQVMIRVDYNPFPFGYIANYSVSSEVASMEFQNNNGTEIPVGSLDPEKAITVMVADPQEKNITVGTVEIEEAGSVNVALRLESGNPEAGLYFQVTFSVLNERYVSSEKEPFIAVCFFQASEPSPPGPAMNYIVLLTCALCFVTYSMAAVIVHKLDLIDINRVGVIPFCTTAHVGVTLYGMESKSGHRHLDGENAFRRNSLDIFQIATERSLGSVWKIRIWHDNKGLSPSWYLQHVIVRDLQTCKAYHFLVNDWLSVESEENDGLVEKEVFATSETELRSSWRIFVGELQRGFFEKHVWMSFHVPISTLIPISGETAVVGLVSSLVVYPLYLALLFLFRMARSKVSISQSLAQSDQQSLEIDNYLDSSILESSFLNFPGLRTEVRDSKIMEGRCRSGTSLSGRCLIRWPSNEALLHWPDLLSDPSIMGNTIQKLKRGRTSRHLGLEAPLAAEEDTLSLGLPQAQARYFSASDEDLIRQILGDGAGGLPHPQDIGQQHPRVETDLISGLSNVLGEKMETIMLQRLNEKGMAVPGRELNRSAKSTRTVVDHALRKRLLPFWCSYLAHAISFAVLLICFGVSVWIGVGFTSSVALMWLISGIFSFLSSFVLWEPLKVLVEALYFSLVAKRLHPEEDDTLVEYPFVEHVSEKIGKVRPPQGFALFQAKEEARKVKLLHSLLKNFLIYMLFLLAILLINYGDASQHSRAFLLQKSIKQQLGAEQFLSIKRSDEFWVWMSQELLPYLYNNQSGQGGFSTTLGVARLRQIRLQEVECPDSVHHVLGGTSAPQEKCISGSGSFDTASYAVGWRKNDFGNRTEQWAYSPPDLAGGWYWGYLSFYDSGGYVQELGMMLEESQARLEFLQQNNWINNVSRVVFVELTQYNPGLGLHAVVSLRLEFPIAGHTLTAAAITSLPLLPLSRGVTLQLLMMVILMVVVVYFVVSESLCIKKAGRAYFGLLSSYGQWFLILATTCTVIVHLSQATLADRQWAKYLQNRKGFTSFYEVASLQGVFSCLAASLLFLLTVKVSQQLRFIRQWSTFGKTLQRSMKELFATAVVFAILTLFSSHSEAFCSFSRSLQLLFTALRSSASLSLFLPEPLGLSHLFYASYIVLELWVVLRLFAAVLIHHYRETRFEMYRPAFESQDYEMVELFVRRLKMWMGFSKAKEFRHKVRFEGMEPLPSRSSSQDSRSLQGPTPSATSDTSRASTSSSQLDGLSLAPSTRDSCEVDAEVQRLLSLLETLLTRFDRVNEATEDVGHLECQLEGRRSWRAKKKRRQKAEPTASHHLHPPQGSPRPLSSEAASNGSHVLPTCPPGGSVPIRIVRASQGMTQGVLLAPHKTQTLLVPAVKRKKPLGAKNRVHPSGQ